MDGFWRKLCHDLLNGSLFLLTELNIVVNPPSTSLRQVLILPVKQVLFCMRT